MEKLEKNYSSSHGSDSGSSDDDDDDMDSDERELKQEDYGPIQLTGFKDYYKNFFKDLVENVSDLYIK